MVAARLYEFEGAPRTLREIQALVPALGVRAIESRLAAGMRSRQEMLNYDPKAAIRAGARRGRRGCGNKLYFGKGAAK